MNKSTIKINDTNDTAYQLNEDIVEDDKIKKNKKQTIIYQKKLQNLLQNRPSFSSYSI